MPVREPRTSHRRATDREARQSATLCTIELEIEQLPRAEQFRNFGDHRKHHRQRPAVCRLREAHAAGGATSPDDRGRFGWRANPLQGFHHRTHRRTAAPCRRRHRACGTSRAGRRPRREHGCRRQACASTSGNSERTMNGISVRVKTEPSAPVSSRCCMSINRPAFMCKPMRAWSRVTDGRSRSAAYLRRRRIARLDRGMRYSAGCPRPAAPAPGHDRHRPRWDRRLDARQHVVSPADNRNVQARATIATWLSASLPRAPARAGGARS